ncbi:hypothetical protein [Nocardia farcinica]|uniref:hypothetical protein n=1 Tax=Nocardia farcinica TaxID=37329 RepID=UPI0024547F98|nr:hypothetical protein [Nocardia farcinica]
MADQLIPATLHRWIRTQLGFWLGEVAFEWTSRNRQLCIPTRQWVHQHAIRLPDEQPPRRARRTTPHNDAAVTPTTRALTPTRRYPASRGCVTRQRLVGLIGYRAVRAGR